MLSIYVRVKSGNTSKYYLFRFSSGTKCACKSTGCGFDPHSTRWNINFTFIFSFLRSGVEGKARRWVPPLNKQCFQKLAGSGERSVLTLGSLCLPCCVRNTAWSWSTQSKSSNFIISLFKHLHYYVSSNFDVKDVV